MDNKKSDSMERPGEGQELSGLRMLVMLTFGVALIAPVVGAMMTINTLSGKIAALKASAAGEARGEGEEHGEKRAVQMEFYPPLEFLVNLTDMDETHYLRTTVSLAVPEAETPVKAKSGGHGSHGGGAKADSPVVAGLKSQEPIIRDTIIGIISSRSLRDLSTPAGKEALKESLCARLQEQLSLEGLAIYFTSFTLQ